MQTGNLSTRIIVLVALLASGAQAQETTNTLFGTPGLIEMPTARSAPDGEVSSTYSHWRLQQKANFTFQLTSRLSGTFRYSGLDEHYGPGSRSTFDRSFDLRYRILDEGPYMPAVAIGLQDFMGTGLLSGEYVVATKAVTSSLDVTAGLGFGRLGSRNGIRNPLSGLSSAFETRPDLDFELGGEISANQFFRGDAALFGGLDYRVNEKLSFQAEYSSDAYERETNLGTLDVRSPINLGLTYRPMPGIALNFAYLYGTEVAGGITVHLNPHSRVAPSGLESAPVPVTVRNSAAAASWGPRATDNDALAAALRKEGIRLDSISFDGNRVRVRYQNDRFRSEAQAMGRVARILTGNVPARLDTFVLEPMQRGIALSATTISRSDLEALENRATAATDLLGRVTTGDAGSGRSLTAVADQSDPFSWGITPYIALILFNGDAPVQADVGLQLTGRYQITPNLVVDGAIRQSMLGERDVTPSVDLSERYHNVRSDARYFGADGGPMLTNLTLTHYGRPGRDLYSRASVGYFEQMFGGVSGEVLWKPVDSRLALGAEANYAVQRDFDVGLGFQDYDVVTGHVSAYYSFDSGFHGQVDVGRYLAGDWGATFRLDREFANGWKVGAYFTLTDMPFEDFGEGSFDKGIRVSVPIDYFLGTASRRDVATNLSSLTRDGGAQLNIEGRLYGVVPDGHMQGPMGDTWGRFWR